MTFVTPSQVEPDKTHKAPGDFERLLSDGRPYVWLPCKANCVDGRVPGVRATKQCPKCKGAGEVKRLYSRITTYIDCLSDKTKLARWRERIILTGLIGDDALLARLLVRQEDVSRDELNALAEAAFLAGDGLLKAQQGTDMHTLTDCWDRMQPLPAHDDREAADFAAWLRLVEQHDLTPVDIERRCVVDSLKVAGTPDRTYWYKGELVIGDLKTTSNVGFDPGKMAMQLAMAAHAQWYDPDTRQRYEVGASKRVGIILHVPNGEAKATLYEADLTEGWRAVQLAQTVRTWRNTSKKLLREVQP